MLEKPQFCKSAQAYSFSFTSHCPATVWLARCYAMPCHWSPLSFLRTCVTYGTPCHVIGHPSLFQEPVVWLGCHITSLVTSYILPNPGIGKRRITLGVASILSMCLVHVCSQKIIFERLALSYHTQLYSFQVLFTLKEWF